MDKVRQKKVVHKLDANKFPLLYGVLFSFHSSQVSSVQASYYLFFYVIFRQLYNK